MRKILIRLLAVFVGLLGSLLLAEFSVRWFSPFDASRAGYAVKLFEGDQERVKGIYTLDPELGYRPELGTRLYNRHGFLKNGYKLQNKGDKERVLFIGDSVTFRGKIVKAIREAYGEGRFEYWNAGVTAYNTAQEVAYFERYASSCDPDHVVLTFHLNDFIRTPISFVDDDGRMQVISPGMDVAQMNPWLFANSHLYRHLMNKLRTNTNRQESEIMIRTGLERLIALSEEQGFRLSVILFPVMKPPADWNPVWNYRYEFIQETVAELGLRHFRLVPALERALAEGVDPEQNPGDVEHPSDAVSRYFAEDLKAEGLLDG